MKIGIISDIHANEEALEAVLNKLEVDQIVCAGDITGYGTEPNKTVEAVREAEAEVIRGNHDAKLVHQLETRLNPAAELALEYNREYLKNDNWEYLEELPNSKRFEIDEIEFAVFHGSPRHKLAEYVYRDEVDDEWLEDRFEEIPDVVVLGHTHVPFKKELGNAIVVNPGSVGQPRDRNTDASFAVIDTETMSVELMRTTYDVEKVAKKVENKFTGKLAERLLEGR